MDRIAKNAEYEGTPSIRHYVMLEQGAIAATVFSREGGERRGRLLRADAVLAFPEIGVEVALPELYDGVTIQPDALEHDL